MFTFIIKLADNQQSHSLSTKLRKKRFILFRSFIGSVPRPLKIIDVGGTQLFWEKMEFCKRKEIEIVLLNLSEVRVSYTNFKSIVGDARDMKQFKDKEFDVLFSNSVIEHVGNFDSQSQMSSEVKRVAKRYFVQTPNRYFPIEPHFLFPLFQFIPLNIKVWLLTHLNIGWYKKLKSKQEATKIINSIRLLSKKEIMKLFPHANIYKEKFFFLTKSFVVYDGWDIAPCTSI